MSGNVAAKQRELSRSAPTMVVRGGRCWISWLAGHPLVVLFIGSATGVCLGRILPSLAYGWWLLAIGTWIGWLVVRHRPRTAACVLLASLASMMAARYHLYWRIYPRDHVALSALDSKEVPMIVRAKVLTLPEATPLVESSPLSTVPQGIDTRFLIQVFAVRHGHVWHPASGRLMARVHGHVLGTRAGDCVELFGTLQSPPIPSNPGERDRRAALRAERLLARMEVRHPECVQPIARSRGGVRSWIGTVRALGVRMLDHYVGRTSGRLASAMLLGATNRLAPERTKPFFLTGTIHLLAISGLHVGFMAWPLFVCARRASVRRTPLLGCVMLLMLLYGVLTGGRTPVLRAVILAEVLCLGWIWRRNPRTYNVLAGAALIVILLRPADLFRSGAQLSFIAVLALSWLSRARSPRPLDPLDQLIAATRPWYQRCLHAAGQGTGRIALAGLVVWLVTFPLVQYRFHIVSPIALLLNVVLAVPVSCALLTGFGVLLTGLWLPPVAVVLGTVCSACLICAERIVTVAVDVPFAYSYVAGPTLPWCFVFYIGLGVVLGCSRGWHATRCLVWIFVWTTLPFTWHMLPSRDTNVVRCTCLSVGHGTCVVMELPGKRAMLYDAGCLGSPHRGVGIISRSLWRLGIAHIDVLFVSHADADHYNAIPELLNRFSVGQVMTTDCLMRDASSGIELLLSEITEHGVPVREVAAGDLLRPCSQVEIRVLHPARHAPAISDNANSLVLELDFAGRRLLLPGDLEPPGLRQLTSTLPRDVDVLMAPHHGSPHSQPTEIVSWCAPEFVVISSGHAGDVLQQQCDAYRVGPRQVLSTARRGAITIEMRAECVSVDGFHAHVRDVESFREPRLNRSSASVSEARVGRRPRPRP